MCIGGSPSVTMEEAEVPRHLQDTSDEQVVSKYELSDKNKQKNKTLLSRKQKRNQGTMLQSDNDNNDDGGDGGYSPSGNGMDGYDTTNLA